MTAYRQSANASGGTAPITRSRRMPPPRAATKPTKATPNRSRRFAIAAEAPDAAKTATPIRSATSRLSPPVTMATDQCFIAS